MVQFAEVFPDQQIVVALIRQLYLRWLDRHERQKGEDRPIALILCAGDRRETVEYLDLDRSGIHVAEYLTELPPSELLARRLHDAVVRARLRLAQTPEASSETPSVPKAKRKRKGGRP
jgi:hypothetical protein